MVGKRVLAAIATLALGCSSSSGSTPASSSSPVGFEQGDTLPTLALVGYLDRNHDGKLTADEHGPLTPADVLQANPKTELLLVHVAFAWCKYCWAETKDQLQMTAFYAGRFTSIQVLVQDRDGVAATKALLDLWTTTNMSAMPTVLERAGTLFARFGPSATYLLVDVKNGMSITQLGAGPPTFASVRAKIADRLGPLPPSDAGEP